MKTLMISPFPRWFLLLSKLLAGVAVSVVQVYMFLAIALLWDVSPPPLGYLEMLPALVLSGLMLGALGLVLSSFIKQLENFAGVMNFVIFPMFFASSALNPLWRVKESSLWLYRIYSANPFTHAVELIRYAMYGKFNGVSTAVVGGFLLAFMIAAVWGYDPGRGLIAKRGGPPE
jgi:ABC-2 type transport system permease protein